MASKKGKKKNITHSYYLYAALLAVKLLAFVPIAVFAKACSRNLREATLYDLKFLTPFWIAGYLYLTTKPDATVALTLLRAFFVARLVLATSYICHIPRCYVSASHVATYLITVYMSATVVYKYFAAY